MQLCFLEDRSVLSLEVEKRDKWQVGVIIHAVWKIKSTRNDEVQNYTTNTNPSVFLREIAGAYFVNGKKNIS
jgi:hypothetical protein